MLLTLKDVCLIVDVVEDVFIEDIQEWKGYQDEVISKLLEKTRHHVGILHSRTKKPPTAIHSPLANATSARETTKFGMIEDRRTTKDSAVTRSRKTHITKVKNAAPVCLKSVNQ